MSLVDAPPLASLRGGSDRGDRIFNMCISGLAAVVPLVLAGITVYC